MIMVVILFTCNMSLTILFRSHPTEGSAHKLLPSLQGLRSVRFHAAPASNNVLVSTNCPAIPKDLDRKVMHRVCTKNITIPVSLY